MRPRGYRKNYCVAVIVRRRGLVAGVAIAAAAVACTSMQLPPPIPDCPPDSGCSEPITGAGGGGGDGGTEAAASCGGTVADSQCDQCAFGNCCTQISDCLGTTDCSNLFSCIEECSGSPPCVSGCEGKALSSSVAAYDAINTCIDAKCPVCAESGIGDPCSGSYPPCTSNLTCNGLWCTEPCAPTTVCSGLGPNGGNVGGTPNVCVFAQGAGDTCAPECATDNDCAVFPGTYCMSTTAVDGSAVQVCTVLPDGG